MRLVAAAPPVDLPAGRQLPGIAVRVALAVVGILLSAAGHGLGAGLAIGIVLSLLAALAPRTLLSWLLILFLAAGQLGHHPHLSWRFLALLAGLHLLHVLGMLALALPWRSWVAPSVVIAPLRRFVAIQVPTQLIAVVALLVLAPGHGGHRPLTAAALGVVGAAALAAAGALLFGRRALSGHG